MDARTSYLVGRLDRLLRRRLSEQLAPLGLTLAEYTALSVLASRGDLTNAQLARRVLITPQSTNEVLARLVERRHVVQRPDPAHGRTKRTSLTAAGKRLLTRADARVDAVEREMLAPLAAAERKRLAAMLASCVDALR